jgi:hypothetical protein
VLSVTSSGFGYFVFVFGFVLFFFFSPLVFSLSLSLAFQKGGVSGRGGGVLVSVTFVVLGSSLGLLGVLDPDCDRGVFFCWWWYYSEVSDLVVRRRAAAAADGEGKDDSLCKCFPLRLQRE